MIIKERSLFLGTLAVVSIVALSGCGAQPAVTNTNISITNSNANSIANSNSAANSNTADTAVVAAREPERYQATVTVKVEAVGDQRTSAMPTLSANVARSDNDRRMEFTMPAGGRVVFLDKGGVNYLILPDKRQYAELNQESLGFEARRLLMPEQIVESVKGVPGIRFVGEDQYQGRTVLKYQYGAVADTQTQAGQVATESFLFVDKETGLPLRSETVSQSQSGGNVQGFTGIRLVTEVTDIKTDLAQGLFDTPTDMEKIDSAQVKAQVDMIFNALASFATQMMRQSQPAASPMASPAR